MEPIRVLHILHSMNRGGAENSIMNYYRHINRDLVQFDFLLTEQGKCHFEEEIRDLGGKVFRVPLMKAISPFRYLLAVRRFFKAHSEYRIVHSHTSSKSFFPLMIARLCGIPIRISHSHNTKSESGWKGMMREMLKYPLRAVATHYFACGKEASVWLYGNMKVKEGKVRIVPNVIETDRFIYNCNTRERLRGSMGIKDTQIIIGSTSRFSFQKNHAFLISIFASFHRLVPDSVLLLVGDGELRESLELQIGIEGLKDSVVFTGVVPNVYEYLQAIDFFMMPSFNEGLPLSLVEAQISGLRCFASDKVPGESDITGLVSFLPLEEGACHWAEMIKDSIGYHRVSHFQEAVDAGYDASTSAANLESFYLTVYSSN